MFPWIEHESEEFLAEDQALHARFKGFVEDGELRHSRHDGRNPNVLLQSGLRTLVCQIPFKASEELFDSTHRIGTLLKFQNIRLHKNWTMSAGNVVLSDEERFNFIIESYCGSKKGVHDFKGKVEPSKYPNGSGLDNEVVEVSMIGKRGAALKTLFADKVSRFEPHPVSATIQLKGLREIRDKVFIETIAPK